MLLNEMIKNLSVYELFGGDEVEISSIEYDSRFVKTDSLFIAVKGLKVDGHDYINQAIKNGASGIVVEDYKVFSELKNNSATSVIYVDNSSKAMALMANAFYGYPSKDMKMIGITGTNGKTTISYLMKSILESAGKKAGIIGTIGYWIGEEFIPAEKTTPESVKIFEMIKKMRDASIDCVVMEVSSIALSLARVYGLSFDVAAFTNLTQDHLDFHHTFENYFNAKKILFDANLKSDGYAIYNADDSYGKRIVSDYKGKIFSYGLGSADFNAQIAELDFNGLLLNIEYDNVFYKINSGLTGKFNAYNVLTAFAISKSLGIDDDIIIRGIEKVANVEGRFKKIKSDKGFWCIVDYSHTPDSLKNALETIRQIITGNAKVITVFGCGGNRDKTKRPVMGKIASELSDIVIVTSDNPRNESPESIIDDVLSGIDKKNDLYVEIDRKKAISKGISLAEKGDVILVAGKGHETYQEINGHKSHFDDSEIINELIKRTN
jgi:UDP-N-acetylmuramoyl-L-alanyl-D-glutamate--2,6-diaminopimelate ligase